MTRNQRNTLLIAAAAAWWWWNRKPPVTSSVVIDYFNPSTGQWEPVPQPDGSNASNVAVTPTAAQIQAQNNAVYQAAQAAGVNLYATATPDVFSTSPAVQSLYDEVGLSSYYGSTVPTFDSFLT